MTNKQIFYDAKGRRRKRATRITAAFALAAAVLMTSLVVSMLSAPFVPGLPGSKPVVARIHPALIGGGVRDARLASYLLAKSKKQLEREIAVTARRKRARKNVRNAKEIVAAFYAPWQETGLFSLRANADKITHLMPEWAHLTPDGKSIDLKDFDPALNPIRVT
jgi:hypothetical protein